jgi:glycosyltransferase involved in cell wall biosynthesis
LLLGLRYDILHLHVGGLLSRRVLGLGLVCSLRPGTKTVFTFHSGGYPSMPQAKSIGPGSFAGFVLRRFDRLIAVNREIRDFFQGLGVSADRIRVIAPHAFFESEEVDSPLPEPLAGFFSRHHPVLISAGQLEPEYDLPLQIDALGTLRARFSNAGLVMVGQGTLETELKQSIAAKPYSDHVLLSGDIPHAVTMQAIARADLMLRTTLYDGDSISVREALHLGTPVIATDNGMRPDGVRLIPISGLAELCGAMEEALALSGRKDRKKEAPNETNLEAVLALYRELAGQ